MERGKVKWFDAKKGFGFIEKSSGGDVFVHISALKDKELKTLEQGTAVEFEITNGKKGPQAPSVPATAAEEPVFRVEKVINVRDVGGQREYLLHWQGYSEAGCM